MIGGNSVDSGFPLQVIGMFLFPVSSLLDRLTMGMLWRTAGLWLMLLATGTFIAAIGVYLVDRSRRPFAPRPFSPDRRFVPRPR